MIELSLKGTGVIELSLNIAGKGEIKIPIDNNSFNKSCPIVVKYKRGDKVKYFSLRLTAKNSLVLN